MGNNKYRGFVYEWTNKINGKKYIGSHIGADSDSYVGSGVDFRKDLKQFGTISFTREVLEYVKDSSDLPDVEKQYLEKVNAKDNPIYYNKTNGSSVAKKEKHEHIRNLCVSCNKQPQAINYIDTEGIRHYRSRCASCIRQNQNLKPQPPLWAKSGYKKKERCEMCNFKAKSAKQLFVYHIDGNLKNVNWHNLKTVCANCRIDIIESKLPWKPSDLVPDF